MDNNVCNSTRPVVWPLTAADLGEVSRIVAEARDGDFARPIVKLDEEMRGVCEREIDPSRVVLGVFVDGRLAATGCGTPEPDGGGYISRVYVDPAQRGRGLGRLVVESVEAVLRERGSTSAHLYYWGLSNFAQRFWAALGYGRVNSFLHVGDHGRGFIVTAKKSLLTCA